MNTKSFIHLIAVSLFIFATSCTKGTGGRKELEKAVGNQEAADTGAKLGVDNDNKKVAAPENKAEQVKPAVEAQPPKKDEKPVKVETTPAAATTPAIEAKKEQTPAANKPAQQPQQVGEIKIEVNAEAKPKTEAKVEAKAEPKKVEAKVEAKTEAKSDAKSEPKQEKLANPIYTIVINDAKTLNALAKDSKSVLFHSKITPLSEVETAILKMNEENYCQVAITGDVQDKDVFGLYEVPERAVLNEAADLHKSTVTYTKGKNEIKFTCVHTTFKFFVEDFVINFGKILTLKDMDGITPSLEGYIHERTENRMINAVKIKDIEKLKKIIMTADAEGFSLKSGNLVPSIPAVKEVEEGKSKITCVIGDAGGELDPSKVYISVEKGLIKEDGPTTATVFNVYRADESHYFTFLCYVQRSTKWKELMENAKGVLDFGVLNRPEYSVKYDELKALHEKIKEAQPK